MTLFYFNAYAYTAVHSKNVQTSFCRNITMPLQVLCFLQKILQGCVVIVVMAGVLAHAGTLGRTAGGQTQGEEIRR